jgi:hypothetical protein
MDPKHTKCILIDDGFLKKHAKHDISCIKSTGGGYDAEATPPLFRCKGKGFTRMILATKASCDAHLSMENANGD